jgi:predicted nucleic acid-binding protein
MRKAGRYVLDTSALLALRDDEAGAERVHRVIDAARKRRAAVYVSFMTRMELLYRIAASENEAAAAEALRLLDGLPLHWVTCEPAILTESARLKRSGGLSVADAWIAATAIVRQAILLHKDPKFVALSELTQEQLHSR